MKKLANFINGKYVNPIESQYIESLNPATGEVLCLVPDSNENDVNWAVQSAKEAFPSWSKTPRKERARILNAIADEIELRIEEFALAESLDQGKTISLAKNIEMHRVIDNFRFFAAMALKLDSHAYEMDGVGINYTTRNPLGVTGLIAPWNLPLYLITWKIAPALAMGNTAVCKPSELTSLTASMLGEIFQKVKLPPGVCNIVMGYGQKVGSSLTRHPDVPLISFTGGTATAEHIIKDSAPFFKKLGLELGGKNANIIFADADLKECVTTTVKSSFQNQGEICLCGSRIFVESKIYHEFLQEFIRQTSQFKVGNPLLEKTDMGALISAQHLEKVLGYIELAKKDGGEVIFGGKRLNLEFPNQNGYFLEPTIIVNLPVSSKVLQDEIFGPVVTVNAFDSIDEVLSYANGVKYGLSSSVWTQDVSKAHKVAQQLQVGTVWVNSWMKRDLRVPFGGVKASGIGREGGEFSVDFYTELKNIYINF